MRGGEIRDQPQSGRVRVVRGVQLQPRARVAELRGLFRGPVLHLDQLHDGHARHVRVSGRVDGPQRRGLVRGVSAQQVQGGHRERRVPRLRQAPQHRPYRGHVRLVLRVLLLPRALAMLRQMLHTPSSSAVSEYKKYNGSCIHCPAVGSQWADGRL